MGLSVLEKIWLDLTWSWFYFSSAAGIPVAGVGSRWLVLLILAIVIVTWKFYETAYPSCRLNSTFTVSEKPPFPHLGIAPCRCPSHMPMNCCHKIPVTRLQCYCHLGCNRLLEIAVVTQYPVTEPLEFFEFHPPRPRWLTSSRKTSALCCRVTTNLFDP